jgi:hydrogenase-4 component E
MIAIPDNITFFLEAVIFASVIFMHLAKQSYSVVALYILQSLMLVLLLISSSLGETSVSLILAIAVIFAVKVVIAPRYFFGLIKEHQLKFSVSTYLSSPATLVVLALLTGVTYSHLFEPLAMLSRYGGSTLLLAVASMFISIFLIINRRGALSQMIGILSLENGIVSFASLAGLEQTPGLQIGIMFDIGVWILIATIFVSMIYRQFGSLDVASMQQLKEE